MARTRSTVDEPNATRTLSSAIEIPPHSNYATQGGNTSVVTANPVTQTPGMNPQDQGLNPQGTNPQLQAANAPLNTQGPGFQMSTTVVPSRTNPNPTNGMPFMP